jgi:hypothetical protein
MSSHSDAVYDLATRNHLSTNGQNFFKSPYPAGSADEARYQGPDHLGPIAVHMKDCWSQIR